MMSSTLGIEPLCSQQLLDPAYGSYVLRLDTRLSLRIRHRRMPLPNRPPRSGCKTGFRASTLPVRPTPAHLAVSFAPGSSRGSAIPLRLYSEPAAATTVWSTMLHTARSDSEDIGRPPQLLGTRPRFSQRAGQIRPSVPHCWKRSAID